MGKILILSFENHEEDMLNRVVELLGEKNKDFQYFGNISGTLCFQDIQIDASKRIIIRNGKELELTFTEFEILQLLAKYPGQVFSKEKIYDAIWKDPYDGDYSVVTSHIRNIREKIEDNPSKPIYIQTVWGMGYRFNKKISSNRQD